MGTVLKCPFGTFKNRPQMPQREEKIKMSIKFVLNESGRKRERKAYRTRFGVDRIKECDSSYNRKTRMPR